MTPNEILVTAGASHLDEPRSTVEKILAANPFQIIAGTFGKIARGGHLYVTATELSFQPHALNINTEHSRIRIPIVDITGMVTSQKMLAAILTVHTRAGFQFDFICWQKNNVIEAVQQIQSNWNQ